MKSPLVRVRELTEVASSSFSLEKLRRAALGGVPKQPMSREQLGKADTLLAPAPVATPPVSSSAMTLDTPEVGASQLAAPVPAPSAGQRPPTGVPRGKHEPHPLAAANATVHRTRPELVSAADRHKGHFAKYHDGNAKVLQMQHLGARHSSANAVFYSEQDNDHQKALKPLEGLGLRASHAPEAPNFQARHGAVYDWLSSIGAHHMGMPAFVGEFYSHDQIPRKFLDPDETDSQEKQRKMPRAYAGSRDGSIPPARTQVIEWAKGARRLSDVTDPKDREKVDDHHRMLGLVTHLLFSNSDGHEGNVLIDSSGHPIMIDHDMALASKHNQNLRMLHGKPAIRSVFAPGEALAYNANGAEVGTDYPPEVAAVLAEIAQGLHAGRHGLSYEDELELQANANELLTHGLEGALARRHILPVTEKAAVQRPRRGRGRNAKAPVA